MMAYIVPMHCHDGVRFTSLDHPETATTLHAPLQDGLQIGKVSANMMIYRLLSGEYKISVSCKAEKLSTWVVVKKSST